MSSDLVEIARDLDLELPRGQSAFLWGPRKSGKSTYLKRRFPKSLRFDLLRTTEFFELSKDPSRLRERLAAESVAALREPIILDEVQKVPALLDEVQSLIEDHAFRFILCGSSARKLKRGQANLLGGRAWRYELHPLTWREIDRGLGRFDLLQALNRGLVPSHYLSPNYAKALRAYVFDYLKEEIMAEGLARNAPAFSRFLDAAAFSHGELVNYSNIARDAGVDAKTVREYFRILEDTLVGHSLEPFAKSRRRDVIMKAPKFYLFDVGVAGALTRRRIEQESGSEFGRAFEHLILMELVAHRSYRELDYPITFWRTKAGLEVDFVLGDGEVAVEVKGSSRVHRTELNALGAFHEEHRPRRSLLVCNEKTKRKIGALEIWPWRQFFNDLWEGKVIA